MVMKDMDLDISIWETVGEFFFQPKSYTIKIFLLAVLTMGMVLEISFWQALESFLLWPEAAQNIVCG